MASVVVRGAAALTLWATSSLVAAAWERLHNERISGERLRAQQLIRTPRADNGIHPCTRLHVTQRNVRERSRNCASISNSC
jgi:hypothetical protein